MSFLFSQPAPGVLPNDSVSFSELVNINANSVLGNPTALATDGSSISFIDLTQDHLSLFSSTEQGVVPASGGGTTNFLRADGTWVAAGVSTAGALDQQVLAYDSGTGLTTWQYAGLGDGNFSTASLILGRGKPTNSTGTKLTLLGTLAGNSLTTGNASVLIGDIGKSITTGLGNIFIGYEYIDGFPQSGYQPGATTGASVGIGISLRATGDENVAIGYFATAVSNSVAIGSSVTAGTPGAYGGINHVAIGKNATIYAGDNCVTIGYGAYSANSTQIAIGAGASSGGNDAVLGQKTGAVNNVVIGASSGYFRNTGGNNTILGAGSFNNASLTTAANNTIIGQNNSIAVTTASGNVFIGKDCAKAITTSGGSGGNANVAIGQNCLPAASINIFGSVFIGDDAATHATAPSYTVAIGSIVGNNAAMGSGVLVGHRASGSGGSLVLVGSNTASGANTGATAIGNNAAVTGNYGVALGYFSSAGANQFTCGGATGYISQVTFGRGLGVQFPNIPLLITNSRTVTGWTNADGSAGTLTLTPSNSTGNVPGGDLIVETCPSGASGSTVNAYVERLRIKALTEVVVNDTGVDFDFRVEGDTDANLLFVDAGTDRVGIGNNAPAVKLHTQSTTAATNTVTNVLRVDSQSSGTPANGIGVGIEMAAETAAGNTEIGVVLEAVTNDVTSTSEDFDFVVKTMSAGATAAERLKVGSDGTVTVANGDMVLNTAGNGLKIKTGTDATAGLATILNGNSSVTVNTNKCSATSIILVTNQTSTAYVAVTTKTSGSFKIEHANAVGADQECAWFIINPA